jgi:YVTN family beta-propeller protein
LDGTVSVIRTSDNVVTATVVVGNGPWGVAVTPSGDYVYVTNNLDGTVSVIRTSDNVVTARVVVGRGPWGVAVTPSGDYVYVANSSDATVSVISTSDNAVENTISVGNSPAGFGKFIGGEPLQAPSDLVAVAVSDKQIDLSWTDNSYDELGFKIERKKDDETFTEIDTASANVTSYSDTEVSPDTTCYYRVRAYSDAGNSDYSNEADATTDEEESDDCVISAAAHGSPLEPHVNVLSDFRDHFLLSNTVGRSFMHLYYAYSPAAAGFLSRHDGLRGMVRLGLLPCVGVSWVALKLGRELTMALMLVLLTLIGATAVVLLRKTRMRGHKA